VRRGALLLGNSPLSWVRVYISLYVAALCNLFRPDSAMRFGTATPRSEMRVKLLTFVFVHESC
jgi:hypothetical protein